MKKIKKDQKGFTLFIAIVVSGMILLGSYAISKIVFNQLILSSASIESKKAFIAADSGIECAQFYDSTENAFATTTVYSSSITCAGNTINHDGNSVVLGGDTESNFRINFGEDNNSACADIFIQKGNYDIDNPNYELTIIQSRGYNVCNEDNPRRVERGIQVAY